MSNKGKFVLYSVLTVVSVSLIESCFEVGRLVFLIPFNLIASILPRVGYVPYSPWLVSIVVWALLGCILGWILYCIGRKGHEDVVRFTFAKALIVASVQILICFGIFLYWYSGMSG
jgi:hypothetical protein